VPIEKHMEQARSDAADQVKKEISKMAEEVLYIIAKDPEKKHVPGQVQPAGVEKHASKQRQKRGLKIPMTGQERRESRRYRGVGKEKSSIGSLGEREVQAGLVNKDCDVPKNQRDVYEWIGARRVEVLKRNEHG
jgi:hypothetical protein